MPNDVRSIADTEPNNYNAGVWVLSGGEGEDDEGGRDGSGDVASDDG